MYHRETIESIMCGNLTFSYVQYIDNGQFTETMFCRRDLLPESGSRFFWASLWLFLDMPASCQLASSSSWNRSRGSLYRCRSWKSLNSPNCFRALRILGTYIPLHPLLVSDSFSLIKKCQVRKMHLVSKSAARKLVISWMSFGSELKCDVIYVNLALMFCSQSP